MKRSYIYISIIFLSIICFYYGGSRSVSSLYFVNESPFVIDDFNSCDDLESQGTFDISSTAKLIDVLKNYSFAVQSSHENNLSSRNETSSCCFKRLLSDCIQLSFPLISSFPILDNLRHYIIRLPKDFFIFTLHHINI